MINSTLEWASDLGSKVGIVALIALLGACQQQSANVEGASPEAEAPPNIVILYTDDLGYADVGVYGAVGVETPHIDELASRGVRFTDAHSTAATCTPSRYSLLTGRHGFRNKSQILPGDAPLLIRPGTTTVAALLRDAGYRTAVVGKWHLGLGDGDLDWNGHIAPGPLEIGFDYSFLLPATGDRVPTVFVEQHGVVDVDSNDPIAVSYDHKIGERPTGVEHPELLRVKADLQHSDTIVNGVSRIGHMAGGATAEWVDEDFADVFTAKAVEFIAQNRDKPFFLFYSFHDIHVPRLPHPRFEGASTMGPRGDAIAQVDWVVGEIIQNLEELGVAENTIVIFTSDNGPVLDDGYADDAVEKIQDHNPSGPFRGGKYSAYEAGTRVPTIVTWPGRIEASVSDALVSQVDFFASFAELVGQPVAEGDAVDSRNQLDALVGIDPVGREDLILESVGTLSLRSGKIKFIQPMATGTQLPDWLAAKDIESGLGSVPQLFDLSTDIGEKNSLVESNPELAEEMAAKLRAFIETTY